MNISNLFQKSKRKLNILCRRDIFTVMVIILIGFAGFGLGRLSIIEKNKIWFGSIEDARKAGYTPAANCKGLK